MWAGILAVIGFLGQVLGLAVRIYDAQKEKENDVKKQKTEILQSGLRAIVDRDSSRLNVSIQQLARLRSQKN